MNFKKVIPTYETDSTVALIDFHLPDWYFLSSTSTILWEDYEVLKLWML